ncbi:hypothetical protein HBO10_01680 [Pseudomonas sp. WS 5503]|jgi:hypothetical protein|uniref:hypothetical protein n=1 Tax=Pseudomonas TaxID=286 RepID=UPI00147361B9|nr:MULTISPECIES: hypothetical protein [unclassified Pseudomonas]MDE1528180.1 hypothetical protein [Pseudomonas carnis]NMX78229.1 hypothetical protein [Pseudomonas sp. WS 5503]NWB72625.1 hypothetical protein [Pseudomonas sp. G5001]
MTYILEEERKHLSDLLVIAQQRLNTLKEIVATTNHDCSGTDIRLAIGDAITPLNIAHEAAEAL